MKPITEEWIEKAEGDYHTAKRELQVKEYPNYDAVCFHAQQCAEKYLKSRLVEAELYFQKVHDLAALLDIVISVEPGWESMRNELNSLTDKAVEVRYPGFTSDAEDAADAIRVAEHVRNTVRKAFGLC